MKIVDRLLKENSHFFLETVNTMGRKGDITSEKKAEVIALINNLNVSQREIAKIANISVATVNRIKADIEKNISPPTTKRTNCGSKRITTTRDDRKIAKICVENRRSSRSIILHKAKEAGINISDRTLQRRMRGLGFKCHRPAKKPRLTSTMIKKRLEWAKMHRHWTVTDWEKVPLMIFTLFSKFNTF